MTSFPKTLNEIIPLCKDIEPGKHYEGAINVLCNWCGWGLASERSERAHQLDIDWYFLMYLEMALQSLLELDIVNYNRYAAIIGLEGVPYKFYKSLKDIYEQDKQRVD